MKNRIIQISVLAVIASLFMAACGSAATPNPAQKNTPVPAQVQPAQAQQNSSGGVSTSLGAYESSLENIYSQVNPSVVSIRVVSQQDLSSVGPNNPFPNIPGFPNFFGSPGQNNNQNNQPPQQFSQALGSGFVWNSDGYIVTNNHVISGANKIEVTFNDGTAVPAILVGADPDSDLAVVKIDNPGFALTPITVADSSQVKVGQIAVAIGNPFGLENTMTVGIVSALGRSLPANETAAANGASYTIPDIIQTDAPINPGNSGGPLVDSHGMLIGVTSAIESPVSANAGVGFAIPSTIVQSVVPQLISNGKYEHPYVGISGISLSPDIARAMNLDTTQRGALVEEVVAGSPADKAKLQGSGKQVTIDGQDVQVGGDVITAFDGTTIKSMDDIIAYLADHTQVGQKVTLTILRDGKQQSVDLTLEARPVQPQQSSQPSQGQTQGGAWIGIAGQSLTTDINKEMNLSSNQTGVLVEQVQAGGPADTAGIQGSSKPVLINGQRVLVGGDVIVSIDGTTISTFDDLQAFLQNANPGQQLNVAILRNGAQQTLKVTLAAHP